MQYNLVKVDYKSRRSNTYELKVRVVISSLEGCESLYTFESNFKSALEALPKQSYGAPSCFYKVEWAGQQDHLEIWHLNSFGDKDRLVAVVTQEEVTEDEYRKKNPVAFW